MSNYVTINNSTYEFNAYLANGVGCGSLFPVLKSTIEYLEIEDTLAFPGLRGTISISNFYGLLQKLELFEITNDVNVLIIDIINKDADASGALPIKLAFEGILGEAGENSKNIVDRKLTFNFEEFNVGILRNKYITNANLEGGSGTCSDYIKKVILTGLNKTEVKDVFIVESSGDIEGTTTPAPAGSIVKQTQSCYEVLRLLLRNCYFEDGIPGLLQIKNIYEGKEVKRKYKLTNLGKYISEFYTTLVSSNNNADLSSFVLETFITGDAPESNTFGSNFIDKYDIIRPNFKDVLAKKWVDYNIAPQSCSLDGVSSTDFFPYEASKNLFEEKVLGGTYSANLPTKSVSTLAETSTDVNQATSTSNTNAVVTVIPEIAEWKDSIRAMALKSFIYDNTAVTFKVPGNLYREAGYFIQIKVEKNAESKDKTQDISGFYFIISIKHIFSGENYQNEIVAVKLNTNEKLSSNSKFTSSLVPGSSINTGASGTNILTKGTDQTTTLGSILGDTPATKKPGIINPASVAEVDPYRPSFLDTYNAK